MKLLGAAALAFIFCSTAAFGAESGPSLGSSATEGRFVAQIVLLLIVGRGLGEIFQRYGQPAIMGQLIGGILLGPSFFGGIWPDAQHLIFSTDPAQKSMIDAVSQLGILLLLLLTGMETDLRLVRRVGAACFSISITGVAIPFFCGFALGQILPDSLLPNPSARVVAGLFLGTALSISSVKIVAMVVREMNYLRRNLGQIIVSSAIIEDTIGWLIIALTFGIATTGSVKLMPLIITVIEVAAFMAISLTLGRRLVFTLIRWSNDSFQSEYAVITVILVIMGVLALITNLIGVHTVLGAFIAGILVGESPILSNHIESQLRGIITALFMPVFFGLAGLSADLTVLINPTLALLTLTLVAIASIGKFCGAFLGGRLAGMHIKESIAVGSAMNARGSTEVIVASIGLSMNILSHNLFTMIVTMAVLTTLAMPTMLRAALRRLPINEADKQRGEREQLDERGFVAGLERLLLLVDDSTVGTFTAYIAGLIGGGSGMPTTVLHSQFGKAPDKVSEKVTKQVKKGAAKSAEAVRAAEDTLVDKVHLTARSGNEANAESIAAEARKGYGLLLVGFKSALGEKGDFSDTLNDVSSGFDGPLCLVLSGPKASGKMPMLRAGATILVPVNGTEVSRRAADFALALARPNRARVKVLYVSQARRNSQPLTISHRREEGVLKDVAKLADRYGVEVETAIRTHTTPDKAIAREVSKGVVMVVMGVTQRPSEDLFFGATATAVIENAQCPVVLLASDRVRAPTAPAAADEVV